MGLRRGFRGAIGFLTRLPVGGETAWDAFRQRPWLAPAAAYPIGAIAAVPFVLPIPEPTIGLSYVVALVVLTGINHADGLADLGDAAVVHGDPEARRSVMRDTTVGVGGVVALGIGLLGLALGGLLVAGYPPRLAVGLIVAAEVGAKLGMATLASIGQPSHDGLGAALLGATRSDLLRAGVVALPAALLTAPTVAAPAAVASGPVVAVGLWRWSNARLGGASGDVFGACNELARVVALHAGVIAWTLS